MGFLKKLGAAIFGSPDAEPKDPDGIYFYVKCDRCGSPIRIRADRRHDLSPDYEKGGYVLRKEIMDGSCFALINAVVRFNEAYHIVEQDLEGGEFITAEVYQALAHPKAEDSAE